MGTALGDEWSYLENNYGYTDLIEYSGYCQCIWNNKCESSIWKGWIATVLCSKCTGVD